MPYFVRLFLLWFLEYRNLFHYTANDLVDQVLMILREKAEAAMPCGFYFLGPTLFETCPEEIIFEGYVGYPNCSLRGVHPVTREDGCPQHCGLPMRCAHNCGDVLLLRGGAALVSALLTPHSPTHTSPRLFNREFLGDLMPERKRPEEVKFPIKFSPGGNFAVSRENIRLNSRDYYERMLGLVSSENDPEIGHGFERLWGEIFATKQCDYSRAPGW
jgi:hypothetical protein